MRLSRLLKLLPIATLCAASGAYAQFGMLHIGNISVGGTGQFTTVLTSNPQPAPLSAPFGFVSSTALRQDTTWSAGGVASLQMHPLPWIGLQVNYGYTRYQERFQYAYLSTPGISSGVHLAQVPVDQHEATAGYLLHPRFLKLQPYVAVGGGAIDFNPRGGVTASSPTSGTYQWRGAGYLETGFDLPTGSKHIGFRISGRSLYYRAPNFDTPGISTRSWRVTSEPAISAVYKF
jgi:hypothetical protein